MSHFAELDRQMRQDHPCPRCNGAGEILRWHCWDGTHDYPDGDTSECPTCRGVGYDPTFTLPDHDNDDEEGERDDLSILSAPGMAQSRDPRRRDDGHARSCGPVLG